jgi:hypothetical protein
MFEHPNAERLKVKLISPFFSSTWKLLTAKETWSRKVTRVASIMGLHFGVGISDHFISDYEVAIRKYAKLNEKHRQN